MVLKTPSAKARLVVRQLMSRKPEEELNVTTNQLCFWQCTIQLRTNYERQCKTLVSKHQAHPNSEAYGGLTGPPNPAHVSSRENPALFTKIQEHNLLRQYDLLSNCIEIGLQKGIRVSEEATRSRRGRRRYCHVAVSTLSGTQAPQTPHGPRSRRRRRNGARSASGAVSTTTKVMLRKCHCPCCAVPLFFSHSIWPDG